MLEKRFDYRLDTCKNWKRVGSEDLSFEQLHTPRNKFQLNDSKFRHLFVLM